MTTKEKIENLRDNIGVAFDDIEEIDKRHWMLDILDILDDLEAKFQRLARKN